MLRRPRRGWKHNIKAYHSEIIFNGVIWVELVHNADKWRALVIVIEPVGSLMSRNL